MFFRNQYIVIFFLIKLKKNSDEIKLKLQENEVERALWIDVDKLYDICTFESNISIIHI